MLARTCRAKGAKSLKAVWTNHKLEKYTLPKLFLKELEFKKKILAKAPSNNYSSDKQSRCLQRKQWRLLTSSLGIFFEDVYKSSDNFNSSVCMWNPLSLETVHSRTLARSFTTCFYMFCSGGLRPHNTTQRYQPHPTHIFEWPIGPVRNTQGHSHYAGVEPATDLLWVIECKQNQCTLLLFSEAGEKSIQLRQVDCRPCRKMSTRKWETAWQDVSQVTLAASSDIRELISLQKGKVDF